MFRTSPKVPVGISDFATMVSPENDYTYVDKTPFLKEFFDRGAATTLITRPRRHLKSSILSMALYFCASQVIGKPTKGLFDSLAIATIDGGNYMKLQGQFPTIYLSFKDIQDNSSGDIRDQIQTLIASCYNEHYNTLMASDALTEYDKKTIGEVLSGTASDALLRASLKRLSEYLFKHYQTKVVILIDEYDTPINSASSPEARVKITKLIGNILGQCLKDNIYLYKALVTGILRIAKANIFSDLNNLSENSLLHPTYESYFGFTETEVRNLFAKQGMVYNPEAIRYWYNGYHHGAYVLYNPWSIVNCIDQKELGCYWLDTGNTRQINELLDRAEPVVKETIGSLIQGHTVAVPFEKYITFNDLDLKRPGALWGLLFNTGYLTLAPTAEANDDDDIMFVCIPNNEIRKLYVKYSVQWFQGTVLEKSYNQFVDSLITGQMEQFEQELEAFLVQSFSYFDIGGHNPEKVYHAFLLGLVADLHKTYIIKSNRESGKGRYDLLLMPKHKQGLGIIFEFKSVD